MKQTISHPFTGTLQRAVIQVISSVNFCAPNLYNQKFYL